MIARVCGLAAIFSILVALPAVAHHSTAMYDQTKKVTIDGTVKELHWGNPHVWLYVAAFDESGKPVEWVLEGGSPASLARRGWNPKILKPGDKVTAIVMPLKDGTTGGLMGTVTQNGRLLDGD
jgi:hypothetical protein